jgi:hypothetical protein
MTKRIDSYDPNAKLPKAGTHWVWELDKPHACELIKVTEVFWNGEEWWVRTKGLMRDVAHLAHAAFLTSPESLNDLSRFWEAVTPVGGGTHGMTETRPPTPLSHA